MTERPDGGGLSAEDAAFLDALAGWLVERRLGPAAILFLESVKPLNFLGSQALVFFEPVVKTFTDAPGYRRFADILEERDNVEEFLRRIEAAQEAAGPRRVRDRRKP